MVRFLSKLPPLGRVGLRVRSAGLARPVLQRACLPALQSRGLQHGVGVLEPPRFVEVPIVQESQSELMQDMPDLVLGGHAQNYKQENPYRGVPLDRAVDAAEARTAAGKEEGFPEPLFGRLPNGVKIIAVDRQGLCSSLGLFVQAGSRYVSAEEACLPHMLELMAFRSSSHLTHLRTQKTLEQLGAAASCRVGREDVLYQVDVLREYVPVALPLMLANVLCPLVLPEEVAETQQHVPELQQMLEEKPESFVVELLHVAAYQGNSLGYPLYATEQTSARLFGAMTICTEIIPGQFSSLGRQTERSLQKLRTHVEAADKTPSIAMLRVWGLSGALVASFGEDELEEFARRGGKTARAMKEHLSKTVLRGVSCFRQQLLDHGLFLEEMSLLATGMELQLVVLPFLKVETRRRSDLHLAAAEDQVAEMEVLLQQPQDPDVVDEMGRSSLHIAAWCGNVECASLLVEALANVDHSDPDGATALLAASHQGHTEVVRFLLQCSAQVAKAETEGASPLFVASQNGHVEVARCLLDGRADLHQTLTNGVSPLASAAHKGHMQVTDLLIQAEADVNQSDKSGFTPLFHACRKTHSEIVRLLLEARVVVDRASRDGATPLIIAVEKGSMETTLLLLQSQADPRKATATGATPLLAASLYGHKEILHMLVASCRESDVSRSLSPSTSPLPKTQRGPRQSSGELLEAFEDRRPKNLEDFDKRWQQKADCRGNGPALATGSPRSCYPTAASWQKHGVVRQILLNGELPGASPLSCKISSKPRSAVEEFQRSTAATPASREGKRDGKKKATSQEAEEAVDDAQMRKSASMKSLASVQSPTSPKSLMSTMTSLKSLKSMKSMASHVSVSSAASADADTTASSAALGDTADLSGSASPKPTPAFTSQGQDEGNFCETARALFGRFMHPNNIETPEAGHYRVSHSFTKVRSPLWEFGARSKHIPRKQREADCGMELGETWSSFSKAYEPGLRDGYLKLATSRPEPADACHYGMTFAPEHYGAWATLDAASSSSARQPAWDFKRHMHGHTADFAMNFPFFEPGKYNVKDQYTCVGMPFSKGLSRSQSAGEVSQELIGGCTLQPLSCPVGELSKHFKTVLCAGGSASVPPSAGGLALSRSPLAEKALRGKGKPGKGKAWKVQERGHCLRVGDFAGACLFGNAEVDV
ncbi:Ankyrin-1 [Symbiodinium microadriaticum]|uniref:Ankyrin-1 n=1 Tax=Symbiodinium microadriaticum TaxID=2951 RepID=A0A1Q9CVK2_SYMMI|nr:Ankyrin-1 [Symbiodinium microadriaticum]